VRMSEGDDEGQVRKRDDGESNDQEIPTKRHKVVSTIELNVGGHIFLTTRDTLTTSSAYFRGLLDTENYAPSLDAHGRVFVDRDGELFGTMLTLMRSGVTDIKDNTDVRRLAIEAEYFGLVLDETELRRKDPTQCDVLEINVGGRVFSTRRETLSASKALKRYLEDMDANRAALDSQGRLFIDRDPETFEVILRLLQGYTQLGTTGASLWAKLDVLKQDVSFYGLAQLTVVLPDDDIEGEYEEALMDAILAEEVRRDNTKMKSAANFVISSDAEGNKLFYVFDGPCIHTCQEGRWQQVSEEFNWGG